MKDASVKNGKPPPFSPNNDQIFLAVPVIQAQGLTSAYWVSTLVLLESFVVGDVLTRGTKGWVFLQHRHIPGRAGGLSLPVAGGGAQLCA